MNKDVLQHLFEDLMRKVCGEYRFQYAMFPVGLLKRLFGAIMVLSPNFLSCECTSGENGSTDCREWVCSTNTRLYMEELSQARSGSFTL